MATSEALVAAEVEPAVDRMEADAASRERGARTTSEHYLPAHFRGLHASVVKFAKLRKSKAPQDDPFILPASVSSHGRAVIHKHADRGWIPGLVTSSRGTGSERRLFVWHKESKDPSRGKGNQDSARALTKQRSKRASRYGWRLSKTEGWTFHPMPPQETVQDSRGHEREEEVGSIVWYRGGKIVRKQGAAQTTPAANDSSGAVKQTQSRQEGAEAQGGRSSGTRLPEQPPPQQQRAAQPALSPLEVELKREVQNLRALLTRKTEQIGVVKGEVKVLKRELRTSRTAANRAQKQAEEAVRLAEFVATLSAVNAVKSDVAISEVDDEGDVNTT